MRYWSPAKSAPYRRGAPCPRGEPYPRGAPARALLALALLALAFLPAARAQTVELGAGGLAGGAPVDGAGAVDSPGAVDAWLRFAGVRTGATTVALELRAPRLQVGLGLSANQAFGPLGNVVFEARGALAVRGEGAVAEGSLGARGVLGPVALRAAVVGFGAEPGAFRPRDLASAERPHLGGPAAGLQLGVTGRLERDLIIEAAPEAYLSGAGTALRLDGTLRLLRALGPNELRFQLHGYAAPGLAEGAGAFGVGVMFPRGRDPDVTVTASLGASRLGVWPGVAVSLGERLGALRVDLTAAAEPYRLDVPALRIAGGARLPLSGSLPSGSALTFEAALASDLGLLAPAGGTGTPPAAAGTRAWLGVGLSLPLQLP